jgi:catechol 2,3-dioxygenase-like lactoylglutathione lyase family enzyme
MAMTQPPQPRGPLRKVDCVQLPVPDLEGGLAFYRDRLGHELVWRTEDAAGLRLADSDSELVLQTQRPQPEVDFLVDSVDQAATELTRAGGTVVVEPSDIPVGRVAVVADPFGNPLTILDLTRGRYRTDADGNVTGIAEAGEASTSDERRRRGTGTWR